MQYEKVNENVFAIVDGTTRGNVAAFVLPTKVVMIDSGMNLPIIREFRKKVEEVSGKKVEMLILTHFHGDHILGNQVFSDCKIIATAPLVERMKESAKTDWTKEGIAEWKKTAEDPSILNGLEITFPNETFDEQLEIKDGDTQLIVKRTGGHTECSTYVFCPNYKVLVAGDNLFIGRFPWGGDRTADPNLWIETLKEYLSLDVDHFVPGHGPISGKEKVEEFLAYLEKVKKVIQKMVSEGKTKEEILKTCEEIDYYPPSREESKKLSLERWYEVLSKK